MINVHCFAPTSHLQLTNKLCLSIIISGEESPWTLNTISHMVMRLWLKRRPKLVHDYSLVGFILSPNPTIMASAVLNKTPLHDDAVERLITRLFVDKSLLGHERTFARAKLIDTFLTEYGDFINKRNAFARDHIWITAQEPDLKAYRWHQKYSLPVTKVLGRLACLVLSKILGIGTAERNWKQVKAVKSGQRVNTMMNKTTKQVLVYAQYQQARAQAKINNRATAGKLWEDGDFESMKMDIYCKDIQEALQAEVATIPTRHVRLWRESWEDHVKGPVEDEKLKERLLQKYGGLKLYDKDDENRLLTCHKPYFQKKRGDNRYCIFAVMEGYDPMKDDMDEGNYELWSLWELDEALYDCVQDYYQANPGEDSVVLYEKDTGIDSDYGDDGDD